MCVCVQQISARACVEPCPSAIVSSKSAVFRFCLSPFVPEVREVPSSRISERSFDHGRWSRRIGGGQGGGRGVGAGRQR